MDQMKSRILEPEEITPYVRYVNHKLFEGDLCLPERIIYDHEFIYCLNGEAVFLYDGIKYAVTKGDLFYIRPYVNNTMIVRKGKHFRVHCVHFDWVSPDEQHNFTVQQVYLHADPFSTVERDGVLPASVDITEEMLLKRPNADVSSSLFPALITGLPYDDTAPLFMELYRSYCQVPMSSRLKERGLFLQIIAVILEQTVSERKLSLPLYHQRTIDQTINYMKEYYSEEITLPLLASQAGLSAKYFGVMFKTVTGLSVHEYLTNIRLENAKHLLLHTGLSLEQAALNTGFQDKYYFTKLFKLRNGITPGKYRKLYGDAPV